MEGFRTLSEEQKQLEAYRMGVDSLQLIISGDRNRITDGALFAIASLRKVNALLAFDRPADDYDIECLGYIEQAIASQAAKVEAYTRDIISDTNDFLAAYPGRFFVSEETWAKPEELRAVSVQGAKEEAEIAGQTPDRKVLFTQSAYQLLIKD